MPGPRRGYAPSMERPLSFGYVLSGQEHPPGDLVDAAVRAESVGFDHLVATDHFHPWTKSQGHAPFVWSLLGAIAHATRTVRLGTIGTSPLHRMQPAVIAQAAATTSLLSDGRFFLTVGAGSAIDEHVVGGEWPTIDTRIDMLEEAVGIIRALWSGDTVDHRGEHFCVEHTRLFDAPERPIELVVSGHGPRAALLAARSGDGWWGHSPDAERVAAYRAGDGTGACHGVIRLCWAAETGTARRTVRRAWPIAGLPAHLTEDLPTWRHAEEATAALTIDQASAPVPCGPDIEPVLAQVRRWIDAGFDHLAFHQIGPDQDGFFRFWQRELGPALRDLTRVTV